MGKSIRWSTDVVPSPRQAIDMRSTPIEQFLATTNVNGANLVLRFISEEQQKNPAITVDELRELAQQQLEQFTSAEEEVRSRR